MVLTPTYDGRDLLKLGLKICSRCIYDQSIDGITFDDDGICNYCHMVNGLKEKYKTATTEGHNAFQEIVEEIRVAGIGKPYDVIIGVSGGTDSSYLLHLACHHGLRPLAVHYDNTWNTAVATQNIRAVTKALNVDLVTHVCDAAESADIFRSFFFASVPEIDGPTDLAINEVLYRAAAKYEVKYIFDGHSFIGEGISPLGRSYCDGAYIAGIHKQFGSVPIRTFPNMRFWRFLYWSAIRTMKKIRPLWYISYNKSEAQSLLADQYGWSYYGGHHLENRMTAFNHSYYFPTKFNVDQRNNSLSAACREGLISQEQALAELASPPYMEEDLLEYVRKRFAITEEEWMSVMSRQARTYRDYKTYKKRFELFRPVFGMLANRGLVAESFFLKYCFPQET